MCQIRFSGLLAMTLVLSLMVGACAPALVASPTAVPPMAMVAPTSAPTVAPSPTPITLTDGLGRSVTLAGPAQRIVSLAPSNTEILFAIEAGDRLVARDDYSDYPAEAKNVPSIGNLYPKVNTEAVVALKPDLVLAAGVTNPEDVKTLADLGLTVYATKKDADLNDIFRDILAVGKLTGHSAQAEKLIGDLQARVKAVTNKVSGVTQKPVVFYEFDATEPSKPWTAGPGSFVDGLITLAGGTNAGEVCKADYCQISLEQLVAQNPDIIVLGSATYGGQTPELVAKRAGWKDIKAVRNSAVYPFDDNLVSRPGPRVVDGLESLAKLFHPELFK